MAAAAEARHLVGEGGHIAALPAVRDDHDDGAARQAATAVEVVEGLEVVADACAAGPVGYGPGGALERGLRVVAAEKRRQAGQTCTEGERLDLSAGANGRLQKQHERPAVRLHRTRDVAEEHDTPLDLLGAAEGALDRLAFAAHRAA